MLPHESQDIFIKKKMILAALSGWVLVHCVQLPNSFFHFIQSAVEPSSVFFSSIIVFFSSVTSAWYFLIVSISFLEFSLCSFFSLLLWESLCLLLWIKYLSLHLKVFFWGFHLVLILHIFLFPHFVLLCVCFYVLGEIATFLSIEGVVLCMWWAFLFALP